MASSPVSERDIRGLKHFAKIRSLLGSLHSNGCQGDKATNRSLHMDEYCLGVLLYLFNPAITSLRGIQQASELRNVQKKLGIKLASLGSFSESVSVFDPEPLKQIAVDLASQIPGQIGGDFSQVNQTITAVDGSVVDTIVRVAELAWVPKKGGDCKLSVISRRLRMQNRFCPYLLRAELWSHFWPNYDCRGLMRFGGVLAELL